MMVFLQRRTTLRTVRHSPSGACFPNLSLTFQLLRIPYRNVRRGISNAYNPTDVELITELAGLLPLIVAHFKCILLPSSRLDFDEFFFAGDLKRKDVVPHPRQPAEKWVPFSCLVV